MDANDAAVTKDRSMGALVGLLVGEALGVGYRWYYDIDEKIRDHGPWVDDYVEPAPERWHANLRSGDLTSSGQAVVMMMESILDQSEYAEHDFTARLDDMFAGMGRAIEIDGRNLMIDRNIRHVIGQRRAGTSWRDAGSLAVSADAALRAVPLAVLYRNDPFRLARLAYGNITLTHINPLIAAQSLAFVLTVCSRILGVPEKQTRDAVLLWGNAQEGILPSFTDAFLQSSFCIDAARNPAIRIEPAWHVCQLFGLACQLDYMAPAAYYLAARFPGDFEMPVLSALNGGGNNVTRASLTGAVAGAAVGLGGIPQRWIKGLTDAERILELADRVTALGAGVEAQTPRVHKIFNAHTGGYCEEYYRIFRYLDDAVGFEYDDTGGIGPWSFAEREPSAHGIRSQIEPAEVVVLASDVFSAEDSECGRHALELARELGKPVIAVAPWGPENISATLAEQAVEVVAWDGESMAEAIRASTC